MEIVKGSVVVRVWEKGEREHGVLGAVKPFCMILKWRVRHNTPVKTHRLYNIKSGL